ncbi:MAG: ATP-binding cassette domain-containing protein, partial [Thiotrichaceae bacterium]|nr:ATP-binding cassette domain-containing protein [Thiotrichaceae bacterium]
MVWGKYKQPEQDLGTLEAQSIKGRIEFKKVNFNYPQTEKTVINDLNLVIEPGQTVAFVGRSGSGKSTLVSLISR